MFHKHDQKYIQANMMDRSGFAMSRVWLCFLSRTQHWLGQMLHHKADSGRVPLALQDHECDKTLYCIVLLG